MPKNLPNLYLAEANAPEQSEQIHLVTLLVPNEPPLQLATSNYDVQFGGDIYLAFPLSFKSFEQHSDGTISKAEVTIANISREIMYYVEAYNGLRGTRLVVKTVFARFLDYVYSVDAAGVVTQAENPEADPTAYVEEEFVIDSYTANEQTVVFQLNPVIDFDVPLPRRRFTTNSCYWRLYRGPDCDPDGAIDGTAFPSCDKTFKDCKERGNQARFGGFPGVPRYARRIYL